MKIVTAELVYVGIPDSKIISILSESSELPLKPIADAGPDQTVHSNDIVQLDGSNSSDPNSSSVSYLWSQSAGTQVTLDNPTSANPIFVAPDTAKQEEIVFQLTVTNEEGTTSEPDEVTISVSPTPVILKPYADAGPDQTVDSNDIAQLDGGNSSYPGDTPLTYSWNQITGPEFTLSDPNSPNPTFTAPEINEQTDLTFQLTVANNEGTASEPDAVTITVIPVGTPPEEEPKTINDLVRGIIQNPLDVTNSLDSANEIRNILTDGNHANDQLVCDLLDVEDEYAISNIREILDC